MSDKPKVINGKDVSIYKPAIRFRNIRDVITGKQMIEFEMIWGDEKATFVIPNGQIDTLPKLERAINKAIQLTVIGAVCSREK